MSIRIGDIVKILPKYFLEYAPMPIGVVERTEILGMGHKQFQVGFPMYEKKLWMTDVDVEVVGHAELET